MQYHIAILIYSIDILLYQFVLQITIVQIIINVQKQHISSILFITLFVRKIKTPINLEQVFFTYSFFTFLNFHTKILMFSTWRFMSVCFIRVFQFSTFWNCFRVYKLPGKTQSRNKTSTRKHFQFYLLKNPYSELFENKGDEKSGLPKCGWL